MSTQQAASAAPFLWGSFRTFPLAEIFGILALSRQLVDMRFSHEDEDVGALTIKAGHVVGAEDFRTRTTGADALKALIDDPGSTFSVVLLRSDATETLSAAPLGKLAELLSNGGSGRRPGEDVPAAHPPPEEAEDTSSPGTILDKGEAQAPPPVDESDELLSLLGEDAGSGPSPAAAPDAAPSDPDDVILQGALSDMGFAEILEVLQLSEQSLLIAFMRDGTRVGTLTLAGEQVMAATAGSLSGREAFAQLDIDAGETFEVRRVAKPDTSQGLGSVTDLLADKSEAPPQHPSQSPSQETEGERTLLMQGHLSDFPLELVIGSLNLSRQPIELELRRGGMFLHRVQVKSGRIVAAVGASGERARAALAAIRRDPGDEFLVHRCAGLPDGPPVTTLEALLSEPAPAPQPAGTRPAPQPDLENAIAGLEAGIQEIRTALADREPRRSGRGLLRCILTLQLVCLIATAGLIALFFL